VLVKLGATCLFDEAQVTDYLPGSRRRSVRQARRSTNGGQSRHRASGAGARRTAAGRQPGWDSRHRTTGSKEAEAGCGPVSTCAPAFVPASPTQQQQPRPALGSLLELAAGGAVATFKTTGGADTGNKCATTAANTPAYNMVTTIPPVPAAQPITMLGNTSAATPSSIERWSLSGRSTP
jgi:hypothetical protein